MLTTLVWCDFMGWLFYRVARAEALLEPSQIIVFEKCFTKSDGDGDGAILDARIGSCSKEFF